MPSFILDKVIPFSSLVNKLNSLTIDDHLQYVLLHEGVRVQGKIALVGECSYEERTFPFCDEVDVDIFLPNDVISDLNNLQVRISDYTYSFGDESIVFHITCLIEGEELTDENFMFENVVKDGFKYLKELPKELEITPEESSSRLSESALSAYEAIIKENGGEMISTLDEGEVPLTRNDVEEIVIENSENSTSQKQDVSLENQEKARNNLAQDLLEKQSEIVTEDNIVDEQIRENEEDEQKTSINEKPFLVTSDIDVFKIKYHEKKQKTNSLKESRFGVKEAFQVSFSYYRVNREDTYLSIAEKYCISAKKLIDHNGNKELKTGVLLEIPHENNH